MTTDTRTFPAGTSEVICCVTGCTNHAVILTGSAEPGQPIREPSRPFCADHATDVLHPAYVRGYTSDGTVLVVVGVAP